MFFATYDAKELAALASVLKIKGRSKLKKQELFDACYEVVAAAHAEALEENDTRDIVHTATAWFPISCPEVVAEQLSVYFMPVIAQDERYPLSAYLAEGQKRLPRKLKKELRKRGWL